MQEKKRGRTRSRWLLPAALVLAGAAWFENFTLSTSTVTAACAALLFPTWTPLPPLNFMVIHSFTVHFLLALYPLALTLCGDMDPQPRAFPRCFALLAAMAVPIWFFNRAFGTNFMFLMRAGEGNPLKLFERFGSHLLGYPVLLAVVFAVMYLFLRVLRRRTAVPAGK